MATINKSVPYFLIALSVAMVGMLLAWHTKDSYRNFASHQQHLAQQAVEGTRDELLLLLNELRRSTRLFAEDNSEVLEAILAGDTSGRAALDESITSHFPEHVSYTVANIDGEVFIDDFAGRLGELCKVDINQFSKASLDHKTYIHPNPEHYHFDVITNWKGKNSSGIFFISFPPSLISRQLAARELPRHNLYLLKRDANNLIEVSRNGSRNQLSRPLHLTDNERNNIVATSHVEHTKWVLADLVEANTYSEFHKGTRQDMLLVFFLFALIGATACIIYYRAERVEVRAKQDLRKANATLERRVEKRTELLAKANDSLLGEIAERKAIEQQLQHDAFHDQLTGLYNRNMFLDRLDLAIKQYRRNKLNQFAVLFIDLDNFKLVNDSLGHQEGDELLIQASSRIKELIRSTDTFARLGGDEFVILLTQISDISDAAQFAQRILSTMEKPFVLSDQKTFVGCSIGITLSTPDHKDAQSFLRDADTAMYQAKRKGRGRFEIFDSQLRKEVIEQLNITTGIHQAIEKDEITVFYQPLVNLADGKIIGAEALARWIREDGKVHLPREFIEPAEQSGVIYKLGDKVLEIACEQVASLHRRYPEFKDFTLSVNLSSKQFLQPDLVSKVVQIAERHKLKPGLLGLGLEITETVIMQNAANTSTMLDSLKNLGIKLAIDDFGTGYSSLSYLQRFPIDTLKIDKSFITDLNRKNENRRITQTVIDLAHGLGKTVVAEGIETYEDWQMLAEMGCDAGQGFYFSEPIDLSQFENLLVTRPHWSRQG